VRGKPFARQGPQAQAFAAAEKAQRSAGSWDVGYYGEAAAWAAYIPESCAFRPIDKVLSDLFAIVRTQLYIRSGAVRRDTWRGCALCLRITEQRVRRFAL
jgi:Zn-dependent oligopeptidase